MRLMFFLLIITSISKSGFTQKIFSLKITLDTSINSGNVSCRYYNGETDVLINDTFVNRSLQLKGEFYSKFISFHIEYKKSADSYYTNDFFLNEKPANILFCFTQDNPDGIFKYKALTNAIPVYDTSRNKLFKQMVVYRQKEAQKVADFWSVNGGNIVGNDSLIKLNAQLFKSLNTKTISFLKKHPGNYFAFWYYRTQVIETSLTFLTKDKSFLKYLVQSLKSNYTKEYTESSEGQRLINKISFLINPPQINSVAPFFTVTDLKENIVKLSDYKGKYVLLDFWASWCLPCLQEIPFIKQIDQELPQKNLVIIGISNDRDISTLKKTIKKNEIDWINVFDSGKTVSNLFGIIAIPVKVLINPEGIIIYDSRETEDKSLLFTLLKKI